MCVSSSASRGHPRALAICAFADRRNDNAGAPSTSGLQPPPRLAVRADVVTGGGREHLRVEPVRVGSGAGDTPRHIFGPPSAAIASTSSSASLTRSSSSSAKNSPTRADRDRGSAARTSS